MPTYKYTARNAQGLLVNGSIEAANQDSVARTLRGQGMLVTSVTMDMSKNKSGLLGRAKAIKLDDLIIFTRQLATMVSAGLPLIESLDVLGEQMENPSLRHVVRSIQKDVEGGSTLTAAIDKHPRVFTELYINMVKAGEASGMLDGILNQLALYLEKNGALQRKVKGAMVYPGVVSGVATFITAFIMVFIIPKFEKIYGSLGVQLPLMTRVLLFISNTLVHNLYIVIPVLIVAFYLLRRYIKTPSGRMAKDTLILRMPVFGSLFRKAAVAKFTRTLSTLVRSGVNIITALEIVAKTSGNVVIEQAVIRTKMSIQEGETISQPLAQTGVFPPMVTRMISVGEKTGALEEMLQKIAVFYEEQVDTAVAALTSIIEPLLIVVMGVIIGTIVIAMYLPIFNMINAINK
jgi:type IV pilus assembly protein PilC